MKIRTLAVGLYQCNCYVLETENKNAIVIDPGSEANRIIELLKQNNLTVKYILLTHSHFDHIGAVTRLKEYSGAKVCCSENDVDMLLNPDIAETNTFGNLKDYIPMPPDVVLHDTDVIEVDEIKLKTISTPGHSKGSCCFIGNGALFTGDTLFLRSVGRTDLYGGNEITLQKSINKLKELDGNLKVFPGHGDNTILSYEKQCNPYMC